MSLNNLKQRKTTEELIAAAQAADKKRDKTRKTPTTEEKEKTLLQKMMEYKEQQISVQQEERELTKNASDGDWDVKIGDPIEYFDPTLSYELTGYRPITKDQGLDFDPKLFTISADHYRKYGRYTDLIPGTFAHRQHWTEEFRRCRDGYTIGKYTLTGKNYFWLNYYRLLSVLSDDQGNKRRKEDFPGFFAKQYEFFHYKELCKKLGKDINSFKSRGVGFSEMSASDVACDYTVFPNSYSIITAFAEGYVTQTLSKVWQELDFLNTCTEGAFRHVRMKIDTAFKKKASKVDSDKNESGWGSIIEGVVHDNPRKLRGARVDNLIFEECFDPNTLVIMPDYSRKRIKDIKVGDFVMGIDGTPQEVIATHSGVDDMFEIQQKKGENYKVNSKHLLYFEHRPRVYNQPDQIKLMTCQDYFNLSNYNKRTTYGLKSSGLEFGESCDLDPYFFGLWLGDGASAGIELVINQDDDKEIEDWVVNYFTSQLDENHHITIRKNNSPTSKDLKNFAFSTNKKGPGLNKLRNVYNKYNLINNKHIPKEIFFTPIEYRLKVLAGLIDTDGNLKKGSSSYSFTYEIAMSRKELIKDIAELARSCGFYCRVSSRIMHQGYKDGSVSYRVIIHGDLRKIPVLIKRKQLPDDYIQTTNALSTSFNITPCGRGKYVGITLKSYNKPTDNLFLLNDYTIVHNCGSDKVLIDTYIQSQPLVDILGYRIGVRTTGGTGGDESSALAGLKSIFYNPEAYTVLPYKNRYGRSGDIQYTGFFIPAYSLWFGKYDHRGVVDEEAAKAFYNDMFEKTKEPKDLIRKKAEYCFTPEDAFILEGSNNFDQERLVDQKAAIEIHKTVPLPQRMKLHWQLTDGVPDVDKRPVPEVGSGGQIWMSELPMTDDNGIPFRNLYVIGIDGIDADQSTSTGQTDVSKFCIVVFRRQVGLQPPKPVAIYKERPPHIKDAWETALKLAIFYNAKVLVEATRTSVIQFFIQKKKEHYLMRRPQATANSSGKTNFKQYGVPAPEHVILHYLDLIADYIIDYCEQIQFLDMLDEMISYSYENKRKFDIIVAFGLALLANEELIGKAVKTNSDYSSNKLSLGYSRNEYGQVQFGKLKSQQNGLRKGSFSFYGGYISV